MTSPAPAPCPSCGTPATGSFCSGCGTRLGRLACAHCQAELSPQARFCHRCGQPVDSLARKSSVGRSDRRAWLVAGTVCVLLVAGIAYKVSRDASGPAAPDMANAGSSAGAVATAGPSGPAPDISSMTPRERFDRLYNRIMQASERRDSAEVERFTPMALGAYQQLETRDADARYHAAVLQMQVGNLQAAKALADTILAESPGHLFGYLVRGEAATLVNDTAGRTKARRDFLKQYDSQIKTARVEYLEHKPALDEFRADTRATLGGVITEPGATFPNVGRREVDFAVGVIRKAGYSCGSVSGASKYLTKTGFTVFCNQDTYRYEVTDEGGNWQVEVK